MPGTGNEAVLILLDLQEDFLDRPGLVPSRPRLLRRVNRLADGCRARGIAVVHVHTVVRPDGRDRMPHWKRSDTWACVAGTTGAQPAPEARPRGAEAVFQKQFYSAFGAPKLDAHLAELGVGRILLAGAYLHACIRATVMDAYERGYEVTVVDDAVASTDPVHAEITRGYLCERACRFEESQTLFDGLLDELHGEKVPPEVGGEDLPVAYVAGRWQPGDQARRIFHRQPSNQRNVHARVPLADASTVALASAQASAAQVRWRASSQSDRSALLEAWRRELSAREEELAELLVREIGKPRGEAIAEVRRAESHIESVQQLLAEGTERRLADGAGVRIRYRPVGSVGAITPWNNPVAIPVGKLAPALAFGNAVVWKPASQAPRAAMTVMASLVDAGLPDSLVALVFGEAETARHMIAEPTLGRITLTGSIPTGRAAAALCAQHSKTLQAELGGNNAAIVLPDCDLDQEARGMALAAMSFAGQRCTSTRRIIVLRSIYEEFAERLVDAIDRLRVGDPDDPKTEVGPLISASQRDRVAAAVDEAVAAGCRVLCGGGFRAALDPGCFFDPTLIASSDPDADIVQTETFGPVAVMLAAEDLDDAIALANRVPHGLVAGLCTRSDTARRRFVDAAEAGILKLVPGALAVHADAPFGGWKASGLGPPEHGVFDREFYTRPQAVYASDAPGTVP